MICKLDAVYRREDRGGRIEIVDWKTGAPLRARRRDAKSGCCSSSCTARPTTREHGVPLDQIDVALYYVADDLVLRG